MDAIAPSRDELAQRLAVTYGMRSSASPRSMPRAGASASMRRLARSPGARARSCWAEACFDVAHPEDRDEDFRQFQRPRRRRDRALHGRKSASCARTAASSGFPSCARPCGIRHTSFSTQCGSSRILQKPNALPMRWPKANSGSPQPMRTPGSRSPKWMRRAASCASTKRPARSPAIRARNCSSSPCSMSLIPTTARRTMSRSSVTPSMRASATRSRNG